MPGEPIADCAASAVEPRSAGGLGAPLAHARSVGNHGVDGAGDGGDLHRCVFGGKGLVRRLHGPRLFVSATLVRRVCWNDGRMVRDFLPSDQHAVRKLVLDGLRDRWGAAFDASFNGDLDDITSSWVDRGAEVVVIEVDGAIVATGMLTPAAGRTGEIVRMSVAGTHRRQGLGRRVVDALVAKAREQGLTEVIVLTDTPWTSAVALYLACGFEETGRDKTDTHFSLALG